VRPSRRALQPPGALDHATGHAARVALQPVQARATLAMANATARLSKARHLEPGAKAPGFFLHPLSITPVLRRFCPLTCYGDFAILQTLQTNIVPPFMCVCARVKPIN